MKSILTWLLSLVWSSLSAIARETWGWRICQPQSLGSRVMSVGNIQAGGSGKTPLVAMIAREAIEKNKTVCILMRGYGSPASKSGQVIAPVGHATYSGFYSTKDYGDEAILLHQLCPQAWIGVGASRSKQFEKIRSLAGNVYVDLVILDDGFQQFKLKKDLEIVAVTSRRRFQIPYRDWNRALKRADLVVWTKGEHQPKMYGRPWLRAEYLLDNKVSDENLFLVTGVADGKQVRLLLEKSGFKVEEHMIFPDHVRYEEQQIRALMQKAQAKKLKVALTGKDWVKWKECGIDESSVLVFEPVVEMNAEGRALWNRVLWP